MVEVDPHPGGLVEGTHQVFTFGQVDSSFATHRAVHHRQQSGGDHHQWQSAIEAGRGKTGQVAHNPATQGNDTCGAVGRQIRQGRPKRLQMLPAFRCLARWHRVKPDAPASLNELIRQVLRLGAKPRIMRQQRQTTLDKRCQKRNKTGRAPPDANRVRALGQFHGNHQFLCGHSHSPGDPAAAM